MKEENEKIAEIELLKDVTVSFYKLEKEVSHMNEQGVSLQSICKMLNGYNLEGNDYFDVNRKSFCGTVRVNEKGDIFVNRSDIEVWDDKNSTYFGMISLDQILASIAKFEK